MEYNDFGEHAFYLDICNKIDTTELQIWNGNQEHEPSYKRSVHDWHGNVSLFDHHRRGTEWWSLGTDHVWCYRMGKFIAVWIEMVYLSRSWQNQQNGMFAQRRRWSAWASAQSDQSSQTVWRKLGLPIERTVKTDQTGWMPRLIWVFAGRTCHFIGLSWGGSSFCGC